VRSDARDNRERLIRVGAEVLVADGPASTVAEIVKRAGVSESLFFSHFASKDDLIAELVISRLEALRRMALQHADLEAYIWDAAEDLAPHRAYLDLAGYPSAALDAAVSRLIAAAERAGKVRPGVTAADICALLMIGTLAAAPYLHARPRLWRRFVAILVAGLRP
jgi:AcrR family transcriptional regulator